MRCHHPGLLLPVLALLGLFAGCSEPPPDPPAPPGEASSAPILPPSAGGLYIGQEVWITWQVAEQPGMERLLTRTEAQARTLAEGLRAMAERLREREPHVDHVGRLARLHSNAPGSVADGFVLLPVHPEAPDERDLAIMRVREGELTELVRWRNGWWFAQRVSAAKGVELRDVFEEAQRTEVRGQAILFHYVGAHPFLHDQKRTREQALERARAVLEQALTGADFATLARSHSSDLSGDDGGMLTTTEPGTKQRTPWIRLGNADFGLAALNALFRGEVGKVFPELLDTSRGFVIVKPLERRRIAR